MEVLRLKSFEQIHEFGVQWNDLAENSKDNQIFLTLEWLTTWWRYFGANRELMLLAVKDNDKVLALAPLMNSTYRLLGLKLRIMEFIGTPSSDYQSFILTEKSPDCVRMFLDYISRLVTWDRLELKGMPEHSETRNLLKALSTRNLKFTENVLDVCPFIPLSITFEEYFKKLSKGMRNNLLRRERNLKKEHRVEFKYYDEIGSVDETMKIFFELHQKRWQSRGLSGLFSDQNNRCFHLQIAKLFADKKWLRLCFLTVDDTPVSAEYAFEYRQKLYSYLSGFDPNYSKYGVSALTIMHLMKNSIEGNLKEFDFMRGAHSYKEKFNARTRRNTELSVTRFKLVPKVYDWIVDKEIIPTLSRKLRKHAHARYYT